jgi:hypothetical protein
MDRSDGIETVTGVADQYGSPDNREIQSRGGPIVILRLALAGQEQWHESTARSHVMTGASGFDAVPITDCRRRRPRSISKVTNPINSPRKENILAP